MQSTKLKEKIQGLLPDCAKRVVALVIDAGGAALLVGGVVRDLLLKGIKKESDRDEESADFTTVDDTRVKDIDIEIHGLTMERLESVLGSFGPISLVGKSFGVFRIASLNIDWSLPRKDSVGRKPQVIIDPDMSIEDAFRRRDLTINAMGIDLKTFKLLDPFGGYADLKAGVFRAPDIDRFVEDPLRLYRVVQFVGRFEMEPDQVLNCVCASMDVSGVSVERIEQEIEKLFLRSKRPSLGFRWLKKIGKLKDVFPELYQLIGVAQSLRYHPEGDVFEHTMQAIDAAASLHYKDRDEKLLVMYALLCHDLGKITTTEKVDELIRSRGHAKLGVETTKQLLKRMTKNKELHAAVAKLVRYHMRPGMLLFAQAPLSAYKRLASALAPEVTMRNLALVMLADRRGRNPDSSIPLSGPEPEYDEFIKKSQEAAVERAAEEPILKGRDLIDFIPPGPEMGRLLKQAYELQIEGNITDKEVLKRYVLEQD